MTTLVFDTKGSQPEAVLTVAEVILKFPSCTTVYGYRPPDGTYNEHSTGLAEDFMVYDDKALGDRIATYLIENAVRLRVEWVIWQQRIWSQERRNEGWRAMPDRGSPTDNHMNHVHLKISAGVYVPAPTAPPAEGDRSMVTGDVWVGLLTVGRLNSDSVRRMQARLNEIRFPPFVNIAVNGNYDQLTDRAVRQWQQFIKDPVDQPMKSSIGPRQAEMLFKGTGVVLHQGVPTTAPTVKIVGFERNRADGAVYVKFSNGTRHHLTPAEYVAYGRPKFTEYGTPPGVTTLFEGGRVTYPFGTRSSAYVAGYHTGDDWACRDGQPLRTTWSGRVVAVGNVWGSAYGSQVCIEFTVGGVVRRQTFCHLSRIDVKAGQSVQSGQQIGLGGQTGNATGPHCHLEQRVYPFTYGAASRKPIY